MGLVWRGGVAFYRTKQGLVPQYDVTYGRAVLDVLESRLEGRVPNPGRVARVIWFNADRRRTAEHYGVDLVPVERVGGKRDDVWELRVAGKRRRGRGYMPGPLPGAGTPPTMHMSLFESRLWRLLGGRVHPAERDIMFRLALTNPGFAKEELGIDVGGLWRETAREVERRTRGRARFREGLGWIW